MKKIGILVGALILSVLSIAEERKAYILVPNDVSLDDMKVMVKIKDADDVLNGSDEEGAPLILDEVRESFKENGDSGVVIQDSNITSYTSEIKYVEVIVVADIDSTDEVKFMMGYPVTGEVPTYNIIASSQIQDYKTDLENDFNNDVPMESLIEMDDYSFDEFPGKELEGGMIVSGIRVGDDVITDDEDSLHSNIVELLSKKGKPGDETITKVDIDGISINPNESPGNPDDGTFEFMMWAVKTDVNGNVIKTYDENGDVVYKKDIDSNFVLDSDGNKILEGERVLLYVGQDKKQDTDNPLYGDLKSITGEEGQVYPVEGQAPPFDSHEHFIFDTTIRFQSANGEVLKINNKEITIGGGKGSLNWQFFNIDEISLHLDAQGKVYFDMKASGSDVGIIPGGGVPTPPAIAAEFYALDGSGQINERETMITSEYDGTTKYRTSNVKMKVMSDDTSEVKNLEVLNIVE